jgi:hypothetical protein
MLAGCGSSSNGPPSHTTGSTTPGLKDATSVQLDIATTCILLVDPSRVYKAAPFRQKLAQDVDALIARWRNPTAPDENGTRSNRKQVDGAVVLAVRELQTAGCSPQLARKLRSATRA